MSVDWAEVYRALYPDVVRFLYRKVWDADRAHDLAQETFARCLRQQPDNARALVFTVAANIARDEARTVIRRKKHLTLIKSEAESVTAPSADQTEHAEQQQAVQNALEQLSERDREILLLWNAGLAYHEIAAQTGLSIGAIGTTLGRARKRLVEAHDELQGRKHAAH